MDVATLDRLVERVRGARPEARPCLVGVDGADGAGKTTMAAALVGRLGADGVAAVGVSVDGFHRPRAHRYARGRRSPLGFWLDSYDHDALRRELLEPWRAGTGTYRTGVHDLVTDRPLDLPPAPVPARGVLVVDGIFLLRDELVDLWDLRVRLEVPAVERFRRMAGRDGCPPDPEHPDNRRYLLGQQLYERACRPVQRAGLVLRPGP